MASELSLWFARWRAWLTGQPVPEAGPAAVVDSEDVRRAELELILGRDRDPDRPLTAQEAAEVSSWGLALSGGGIRSATFGLGVLQALARNDLLRCFHYQSTVSGGGYIGAFVQGLIRRRGFDEAMGVLKSTLRERAATPGQPRANDPQQPVQHLREYSNYLAPRKTLLSGDTLGMLGTYVRNVLLIQVQLCALLLALCLLPIALYRVVQYIANDVSATALSCAGLFCVLATVLLGWVNKRASEDRENDAEDERPRHGVAFAALMVIVALALASFIGAAALCKLTALPEPLESISLTLAPTALLETRLAYATAALYITVWLIWLGIDAMLSFWNRGEGDDEIPSPLQVNRKRFIFASLGAAVFAGYIVLAVFRLLAHWDTDASLWHTMILGPLITMSAVTLTGIVHVGLAGPGLDDLQREVWARVGGKTAGFVVVGITLTLSLVIYGPWLVLHLSHLATSKWPGWFGAIGWLVTSGSGVLYAHGQRSNGNKAKPGVLDRLVRLAPAVFVLGLLVAISLGAQALLRVAGWVARPDDAFNSLDIYLAYLASGANTHAGAIFTVAAIALGLWLLFGFAVNVNEFSMNAFYRNRLVRCYLGASNDKRKPEPITNFDPHDDLVLADVVEIARDNGKRPLFPLIGTALNLIAAKQLDWQDRKAASFMLTPGYCGYIPPASHAGGPAVGDGTACAGATANKTSTKDPIAAALSLGSAMSISGAAVSPNMGYHSSPAVTFLLTLFDARLGWWLANPNHPTRPSADSAPFSGGWLIAEMLGMTRDGGRYAYLSDGGHFENLGLYELVRRRCRFVLCVDAGADPARDFADLGNAVQKCRVDFGADIKIDVSALQPGTNALSARSCAIGSIDYADGTRGTLLYLKPTLTGAEPTDIVHYARVNPSFPHQPTSDQFFDEAQFESYRRLGDCVATNAIVPALVRAKADPATVQRDALGVHDSAEKERILIELQHRWVTPLPRVHERFALHGKAMSRLFAKLRSTPELAVLDAQIYPAWTDLVPPDAAPPTPEPQHPYERRTRLPSREHFRSCFYFCQELMQLMESVYHDLELEHSCDHPDNRGWMNLFRHWSWAPMFRIAWAASAPTYGARFVAFCQTALDLPHLNDTVRVDELARPAEQSWKQHLDALADTGAVNHVERGILLSEPIDLGHHPEARVFVLRLKWKAVLARHEEHLHDTTLGIAVVVGTTLRVLRVQDHLRKLGLGAEFMRLLVARAEVRNVDVGSGHYGVVGIVTHRDAAALRADLEKLLQQALKHRRAANA